MIRMYSRGTKALYNMGRYVIVLASIFLFKFNASMCESLQPGQVSTECQNYNEEEAAKASLPMYDEQGECLRCKKPEKIEIRK